MHQIKNILITGTNKGIGNDLVKIFLKKQPKITILATSREAESSSCKRWKQIDQKNQVNCGELDIGSGQSIKLFASKIAEKKIKFDVLVNNAGVNSMSSQPEALPRFPESKIDLKTNLFGVMQFTEQILPYLSENCRIINISSGLASLERFPLKTQQKFSNPNLTKNDILNGTEQFLEEVKNQKFENWFPNSYAVSKMLLNGWSRFLLRKLLTIRQQAICISPGLCRTQMGRHIMPHLKAFTSEEGAESIYETIYLETVDSDKFYHRARQSTFLTCGTQFVMT